MMSQRHGPVFQVGRPAGPEPGPFDLREAALGALSARRMAELVDTEAERLRRSRAAVRLMRKGCRLMGLPDAHAATPWQLRAWLAARSIRLNDAGEMECGAFTLTDPDDSCRLTERVRVAYVCGICRDRLVWEVGGRAELGEAIERHEECCPVERDPEAA